MYKSMFNKLFSFIKETKNIMVHSCIIRNPHPQIEKLVSEYSLSLDIANFYREMNGCQLSYTLKSNKGFDKDKFGYYDTEFPYMWPNENYWQLDGCINILPVDFVCRNNWKEYIWFENKDDRDIVLKNRVIKQSLFEKKIKPFDVFSKESIAGFFIDDEETIILLSTDHNASFLDYMPMNFREYIEAIIKSKGLITNRKQIFKRSN